MGVEFNAFEYFFKCNFEIADTSRMQLKTTILHLKLTRTVVSNLATLLLILPNS